MGSMSELENEVTILKQKLLTHEIATGLILADIVKILDIAKPGAIDAMSKAYEAGQVKIAESPARNDPHTKDAFKIILNILERARGR